MMGESQSTSVRDAKLHAAIAEYLQACETGSPPPRADFVNRHVDLAQELEAFFENQDQFARHAEPLSPVAPTSEQATLTHAGGMAPLSASPATQPVAGLHPKLPTRIPYFGDYELLDEIGRGGMGVVWKARQVSLKRVVALKMILAGQLAHATDVQRFHAEAQAAAKLDHPGIVPVFEVGEHDGHQYFTMAFVEGRSLALKLLEGLPAPREAALLLKQIAEAVAYAHLEGVVHRDLKPANILIDKTGQLRLTDFGLAKRVQNEPGATGAELTQSGQVLGTPSYMPPEQASGKRGAVGPLSDVYSLGAVFYALLTGRPPFQAATALDTLLQVLDQEPAPPRQLNRSIPRDLETICLKCLEKEPSKRYASARALVADLERFLSDQPIHARPATRRERVGKWMRRRPAAAALVIMTVISTVALIVLQVLLRLNADRLALAERDRGNLLAAQVAAAQSHVYSSDYALAVVAFEKQNVTEMTGMLNALRPRPGEPDLRGFEWHYLWRQAKRERGSLPTVRLSDEEGRASERITERRRLVFSPDGKLLATRKQVCNVATGRVVLDYDDVPGSQIFFSPDSRFIFNGTHILPLTAAEGGKLSGVKIPLVASEPTRDVAGNPNRTHSSVPLGFLPNNVLVVLHPDSAPPGIKPPRPEQPRIEASVKSYDAATGKETLHPFRVRKGQRILAAALSEKRGLLAVATTPRPVATGESVPKDQVEVWDLNRPGHETSVEPKLFQFERFGDESSWGLSEDLRTLLFSPDGKTLAVITRDEAIRLCDADTGKEGLQTRAYCRHLSFSEDGKTVLSLGREGNDLLRIWDVATGKELVKKELGFAGHQNSFGQRAEAGLSHDGKTYATGGGTRIVQLWDTATGKLKATYLGHHHPIRDLLFSADGKILATRDQERRSPKGDTTVKLWDSAQEKPIGLPVNASAVTTFARAPDGNTLAVGFADGWVRLCEVGTLKVQHELQHRATAVQFLQFAPDGKRLAASHTGGDKDNNIDVWNLAEAKVIASFPGTLRGFDGKIVASIPSIEHYMGSPEPPATITLFDVATKEGRLEVKDSLNKLFAMSPDSHVAATAMWAPYDAKQPNRGQRQMKVWSVATGKELTPSAGAFDCRGNRPSHLIFSPDSKFLTMCNTNLEVRKEGAKEPEFPSAGRLYDVTTGKTIVQFPLAYRYGESVGGISNWMMAQFSPDSKLLLTIANDGDKYRAMVSLWDTATGKEVATVPNPEKFVCMHAAFSPDGKSLAVVTIGSWRCERWRDGKFINDDSAIRIEREEMGYDGDSVGMSGGSSLGTFHPVYEVHIWDVGRAFQPDGQAGKPDLQHRRRFLVSWQAPIHQIAFSGDGQTIHTLTTRRTNDGGEGRHRRLQAWDLVTGKESASIGDHGTRYHALAFAPDGRLLALTDQVLNQRRPKDHSNDYRIRTWDVADLKELSAAQVFTATEMPLDLDPKSLAVAPNTSPKADAWESDFSFGSHSSTAVSPDGKVKAVRAYRYPIHSAGPDGRTKIDPTPTDVTLVDVASDRVLHTLKGYGQWVSRLAFSPDGKTLAVGETSGKINLWNVAAGRLLLTISAHAGSVNGLAFRGDGRVLASCNDHEIRLWQAATNE